jgi:hypothetical protein
MGGGEVEYGAGMGSGALLDLLSGTALVAAHHVALLAAVLVPAVAGGVAARLAQREQWPTQPSDPPTHHTPTCSIIV